MSSIGFNSNLAALMALRHLGSASDAQSRVFERLSSGLRINRASDDAAGLAIASSLSTSSRIYNQALRNTNDGISALNVANGGLSELSNITIRLKELATQASSGTFSRTQRLSLQGESDTLINEFNRIISTTSFNGMNLLDLSNATMNIQQGVGTAESLQLSLGSELDRATLNNFRSGTSVSFGITGLVKTVTGDFNGDGKDDLIATGSSGTRFVAGNGDGTFGSGAAVDAVALGDISVGDIDNDGDLDLVGITSGTNRVRVLRNGGSANFAGSQMISGSVVGTSITLGDFNGDSKLDFVETFGDTSLAMRLGNGDGTFGSPLSAPTISKNANFAVAGDINGDGKDDLLLNSTGDGIASILLSNGNGTFASAQTMNLSLATNIDQMALADFNRDGLVDLVGTNTGRYSIALGNGDGTFGTASVKTPGTFTSGVGLAVGDINGDGYFDLGFSSAAGAAYVLGNGNGTFGSITGLTPASGLAENMVTGDFNNDGVLDFASTISTGLTSMVWLAGTTQTTSIGKISLATQDDALASISKLDLILDRINKELGVIGSLQSRLETGLDTLAARAENYKAAESRITDADIAFESANLLRTNILKQSATSVLAQANQQPTLALQLLKNI